MASEGGRRWTASARRQAETLAKRFVVPRRTAPQALPRRWALILVAAAWVGTAVGFTSGFPAGLAAGLSTAVSLHRIMA
jgi:hypothetical protein